MPQIRRALELRLRLGEQADIEVRQPDSAPDGRFDLRLRLEFAGDPLGRTIERRSDLQVRVNLASAARLRYSASLRQNIVSQEISYGRCNPLRPHCAIALAIGANRLPRANADSRQQRGEHSHCGAHESFVPTGELPSAIQSGWRPGQNGFASEIPAQVGRECRGRRTVP